MVICEGFSLVESDLFPFCKRISSFLYAPFLIAGCCQQPVRTAWGQTWCSESSSDRAISTLKSFWKM